MLKSLLFLTVFLLLTSCLGSASNSKKKDPSPIASEAASVTPTEQTRAQFSVTGTQQNVFRGAAIGDRLELMPGRPARGMSASWDGRLLIQVDYCQESRNDLVTAKLGRPANLGETVDYPCWRAAMFRPEAVNKSGSVVGFHDVVTSTLESPVFATTGANQFQVPYTSATQENKAGIYIHVALSKAGNREENPYSSDIYGNYSENGSYKTYDAYLFQPTHMNDTDGDGKPNVQLGKSRALFIVGSPESSNSKVVNIEIIETFDYLYDNAGQKIYGIEPTATADGRLVLFQGDGQRGQTGGIDRIMYTVNSIPGSNHAWEEAKNITYLYHHRNYPLSNGQTLAEKFSMARKPLMDPLGVEYSSNEQFFGAYPWFSWDGSELFYTSFRITDLNGNRNVGARRSGYSVVGTATGYRERLIDENINTARHMVERSGKVVLTTTAVGADFSFWKFDNKENQLPLIKGRHAYHIVSGDTNSYHEVSMKDFLDGYYLMSLPMNVMFDKQKQVRSNLTGDISGYGRYGELKSGAKFPLEYGIGDQYLGVKGQAILFPAGGHVEVKVSGGVHHSEQMTVEAFVNRRVATDGVPSRWFPIVQKHGSFHLHLEADGRISSKFKIQGQLYTLFTDERIEDHQWNHVATTFDVRTGHHQIFINGRLSKEMIHLQARGKSIDNNAAQPVLIGPHGTIPWAGDEIITFIDEVKVSRKIRSQNEIALSAMTTFNNLDLGVQLIDIPAAFTAKEALIPGHNPITNQKIVLGKSIFFDPVFSDKMNVSCATCHRPDRFSATNNQFENVSGTPLRRNSPTISNLAFQETQMFDGRASGLENQILLPLISPHEMNISIDELERRINEIPAYRDQLIQIYGEANVITFKRALASYLRSVTTEDSSFDRHHYLDDQSALDANELAGHRLFFGKAKCSACHSGGMLGGEIPKNPGFFTTGNTSDGGLFEQTARSLDIRKFKAPSLRNIEHTGPYFHNGMVNSLEEVVDLYESAIFQDGENRDTEVQQIVLNDEEKEDLVSFLKTLSSPLQNFQTPSQFIDGRNSAHPTMIDQWTFGKGCSGSPIQANTVESNSQACLNRCQSLGAACCAFNQRQGNVCKAGSQTSFIDRSDLATGVQSVILGGTTPTPPSPPTTNPRFTRDLKCNGPAIGGLVSMASVDQCENHCARVGAKCCSYNLSEGRICKASLGNTSPREDVDIYGSTSFVGATDWTHERGCAGAPMVPNTQESDARSCLQKCQSVGAKCCSYNVSEGGWCKAGNSGFNSRSDLGSGIGAIQLR